MKKKELQTRLTEALAALKIVRYMIRDNDLRGTYVEWNPNKKIRQGRTLGKVISDVLGPDKEAKE